MSLFQPDANGNYLETQTGSNLPFSTRPVPRIVFCLPGNPPPQAEQVFYLRIHSTSSVLLPVRLWSAQAYERHQRNDYFPASLVFRHCECNGHLQSVALLCLAGSHLFPVWNVRIP